MDFLANAKGSLPHHLTTTTTTITTTTTTPQVGAADILQPKAKPTFSTPTTPLSGENLKKRINDSQTLKKRDRSKSQDRHTNQRSKKPTSPNGQRIINEYPMPPYVPTYLPTEHNSSCNMQSNPQTK